MPPLAQARPPTRKGRGAGPVSAAAAVIATVALLAATQAAVAFTHPVPSSSILPRPVIHIRRPSSASPGAPARWRRLVRQEAPWPPPSPLLRESSFDHEEGQENHPQHAQGGSHSHSHKERGDMLMARASTLPMEVSSSSSSSSPSKGRGERSSQSSWLLPASVGPYIEILRPQNILPSMLLVVMGAWVGTHDPRSLLDPVVLAMSLASALVAVGSCVLNDWFDLRIDRINKPGSSLVQGKVDPAHALGIATACLGAALAASWAAPAGVLRDIVRTAVVAVTLYTPVFKPVPFLKNAVVAAVTGASLALGGLATGAPLASVAVPAAMVFLGIYHREILMDIDDVEGDTQCQILTLPRLLGKKGALAAASALFSTGTLLSAYHVLTQNLALGQSLLWSLIPTLLVVGSGAAACVQNRNIFRRGFRHEDISRWVALSPIPIFLTVLMLGTAGGGGGGGGM